MKNKASLKASLGLTTVNICLASLLGLLCSVLAPLQSAATTIAQHNNDTNPLFEGFAIIPCVGSSTVGPITNDMGHDAWSIAGDFQGSQFGYSDALSASQWANVTANGAVLSFDARVIQGLAPAYDNVNHVVIGFASLDIGTKRFDVWLGLDSDGDTVVSLPSAIDAYVGLGRGHP